MPCPVLGTILTTTATDDSVSDVGSDADMEHVPTTSDVGANSQLNGELNDDVDEAAAVPTTNPEDKDDEDDNDDEDSEQEEDEFVVETIRGHSYLKNKLVYEIKWVGYSEAENTLEPESNLLP